MQVRFLELFSQAKFLFHQVDIVSIPSFKLEFEDTKDAIS